MLQRIDHSQDLKELAQQVLSRSIARPTASEDDMMVVASQTKRVVEEIEAYRRIS